VHGSYLLPADEVVSRVMQGRGKLVVRNECRIELDVE
jgi:hypothetical protein